MRKARTSTQSPTMAEFSMTACFSPSVPIDLDSIIAPPPQMSNRPRRVPADILFHRMARRGKRRSRPVSRVSPRPVVFRRDQIRRMLHPRLRRTRLGRAVRAGDSALLQRRARLLQIERLGLPGRIDHDRNRIGTAGVARRRVGRTGRRLIVDGRCDVDAVERGSRRISLHALDRERPAALASLRALASDSASSR